MYMLWMITKIGLVNLFIISLTKGVCVCVLRTLKSILLETFKYAIQYY